MVLLAVPSLLPLAGLSPAGAITMGLFLMAVFYWITEPIPIYATSLLIILFQLIFLSASGPFVQAFEFPYPAGEAPKADSIMATLAHPTLILFLGGFMLAAGAVKYSLEKNLVRVLLAPFQRSPRLLLLGIMVATGLLSAFMSNTATTAMMITIILPLLAKLEADDPFRISLALSIPVAANLGGIATPIGTPPNAIALAALAEQGQPIAFLTWMAMAAPIAIVALLFGWVLLSWIYRPKVEKMELDMTGKFDLSPGAVLLYLVAGLTVVLWATESLHRVPSGVIAFVPVALLPCLGVIGKSEIRSLSWEVLWLVAGGISLGVSLRDSGLAEWLIGLVDWTALGSVGIVALFVGLAVVLANFLSHTVTTSLLLPIAVGLGSSGILSGSGAVAAVAVAVAISSSFGMSLPISTPPNAIAISTGVVTTPQMARIGAVMAVFGFVVCLLLALFCWPHFSP